MPRASATEYDRLAAVHRRRLRAGTDLATRIEQADRAAKAAGLRPALANTLYRGTETLDEKGQR